MDKNTLSQYGWVIICIIVLAIMIGLASPFGNFISASVDNTTHGFGNKVAESLEIGQYSKAITELAPMATTITSSFAQYADEAETPNYIYAKQMDATTIEEALEARPGITYERDPSITGFFGTGDIIKAYKDGKLLGTYYLVVLGDITGDGTVDVMDSAHMARLRVGQYNLTGADFMAADVDRDGVLETKGDATTDDYQAIKALTVSDNTTYAEYYNAIMA